MAGESWTGGNPFLGTNNPYLQGQIDSTLGDITRNYNLAVKPQTETAMANSGSFGNSGLMQLQGEQQRQLAQTQQKADFFEAVVDVLKRDYGVSIVKKPRATSSKRTPWWVYP